MIHSLSLIRHWVNTRRTTNENNEPRSSALSGPTKVSSFDPLLTTIGTAHRAQPLLPFFHPPVELASMRPHGRLHLDRRKDACSLCG
jgi:hypothetical protein